MVLLDLLHDLVESDALEPPVPVSGALRVELPDHPLLLRLELLYLFLLLVPLGVPLWRELPGEPVALDDEVVGLEEFVLLLESVRE